MMKAIIESIVCGTTLALLAGAAVAQSSSDPSGTSGANSYQSTTGRKSALSQESTQDQKQFFQAKNFIGEKVKNAQDQSLGSIKDIVFNPQNGETFAAIEVGNSRYALIPWQALTVTTKGSNGKEQVSLNTTKQSLQTGPTIPQDQWEELNNRTFVQSIYSHYNVQPPTGMGGALGSGTSGSSTGTSSDTSGATSSQGTSKPQR
jgi:hypothetical protein